MAQQQQAEFKLINTSWMLQGVTCWVQAQESDSDNNYIRGIIIALTPKRLHARITYPEERGPEEAPVQQLLEANQDYDYYKTGWDDMVTMNVLNEAEIIANVRLRYLKDIIFTYIGPTLIVMNPYKLIKESFLQTVLDYYQQELFKNDNFDLRDCPPHVYAISAQAYSQMFSTAKNQAIVISGESGAGKTENAKYAMKFLTSLSKKSVASNETPIEDKILSCNPILEAFGNAKTVRNDNSSRFGKYVRIWVEKKNRRIIGASISNYLLEKSRVTQPSEGERNYHIFYHILKGYPKLEDLELKNEKFEYIQGSMDVDTINDKALYEEVVHSFRMMAFTDDEVNAIHYVISAILLLGNMKCDDKSLTDTQPCSISTPQYLKKIAKLLQTEEESSISSSILMKTREVAKQVILSPNSKDECDSLIKTLARAFYDKLFNWLVKKLNQTIIPSEDTSQTLTIGLLDIFGFENFALNSFEQLCINFTNEKLQQLYISYVFKSEEHEFVKEGLKDYLQALKYNDNQNIIDLIDKYPMGIFDLLDESCQLGQGTDEQLIQKLAKTYTENDNFKVPKMLKDKFTLVHTPKNVEYCILGFRMKNKDELSKDLERGVMSSKNESIIRVWQCTLPGEMFQESGKQSTKENKFLSAKFRRQMKELMEELSKCDVHFIRCIKPNEVKRKDYFVNSYVLLQIRYLGILESVKVRKEGYPIRSEYGPFYTRYHELDLINRKIRLERHVNMGTDMKNLTKEIVQRIFPKLEKKLVLYGNSKIYMKMDVAHKLDRLLQEWWKYKSEKAAIIQKAFKHYMDRKRLKQELKKIHQWFLKLAKLQALVRMHQKRKRFLRKKAAIAKAKKYLNKLHIVRLKRNFDKFKNNSAKQPKKEKNKAMILTRKFLPCLDKYFKRIAIMKWKDYKPMKATLKNGHKRLSLEKGSIEPQFADQYDDQLNYENILDEFGHLKNDLGIQLDEQIQQETEEVDFSLQLFINKQQQLLEMPTDQFEVQSLRIWSFEQFLTLTPLMQHFIKQQKKAQMKSQNSLEFIFRNNQKYNEVNQAWLTSTSSNIIKKMMQRQIILHIISKLPSVPLIEMANYQMSSEKLNSSDYDGDFLAQVKQNNFLLFCDSTIYKSSNFSTGYSIEKIMSFSSTGLKFPLLPIHAHFKDALEINRCMLKLCGVRRSRHTKEFLQERILVILLGPNCILPLPPAPEQFSQEAYVTLRFYKEKKMEQLLPGYRAFAQLMQKKQREDTVILYKAFINLVKNKFAGNISEWQQDNQLQTGLVQLRDEAYLQLSRLIYGNPNEKSIGYLYKFGVLLSYLIGPSKRTIFAVLNFYLDRMENEKDDQNKNFARLIFNNLARQAIQLEVLYRLDEIRQLQPKPPNQIPGNWLKGYAQVQNEIPMTLIKKLKLYKRDPIGERLAKIQTGLDSLYDLVLSAFSIVSGRLLLPSIPERLYITQRKQLLLRVSLPNDVIIWVPFDPMNTMREVKNLLMYQLNMDKLNQYFSLWQTVELDGKEVEGFWALDSCKVLDLVAKEINDLEIYKQYFKKRIVIKVTLKIKIFFPIFKEDTTSILFLYYQLVAQVIKGELPIGVENAINLAALQLYIDSNKSEEITQEQLLQKMNQYVAENLLSGAYQSAVFKQHKDRQPVYNMEDWARKILRQYTSYDFENIETARWLYVNRLRSEDLFMAQQIKCSIYLVTKGNFGLLRRKKYFPGYLGVRPNHLIIVDWPSRKTFKIIDYHDLIQWGRAVGSDNQLFVRLKSNETIFFQMGEDGIEQVDYFLNAYLNWEYCLPVDNHLVPPPTVQKTEFNLNQFNTVRQEDNGQDLEKNGQNHSSDQQSGNVRDNIIN